MIARAKKVPAPALATTPVGAVGSQLDGIVTTIESMRAIGIDHAAQWVDNVAELRDHCSLMRWRDDMRDEIREGVENLDNHVELLAAWTAAFDDVVAGAGSTLSVDEQHIVTAFQTMDQRHKGENLAKMERDAKAFPGANPSKPGLVGAAPTIATASLVGINKLRGEVSDLADEIECETSALRDILGLVTEEIVKTPGTRAFTLVRSAQRFVRDIEKIAEDLHEIAKKQGVSA